MTTPLYLFLKKLFEDKFNADMHFEVRAIRGRSSAKSGFYLTDEEGFINCISECALHAPHWDLYVGVLVRNSESGTDADCPEASWLWLDIDASGRPETVQSVIDKAYVDFPEMPAPAITVKSGSGGMHLYWRIEPFALNGSAERKTFQATLRRICLLFKGGPDSAHSDTTCTNPSRIMRIPGTLNHKHCPPIEAEASYGPEIVHSLHWWRARLPALPEPITTVFSSSSRPVRDEWVRGIPPKVFEWAKEPYPEGERHGRLTRAAVWLRKKWNVSDQDGYDLLLEKGRSSVGSHPVTEQEIDKIWRWARNLNLNE